MEHLDLHRVSDPRFVAVDVPVKPPRGWRRMICPVDSTIEELSARHVLEDGQRERILAGFEAEDAWRIEHRGTGEPLVTFGPGVRGDIEARAGFNWRPSSTSTKAPPDSAVVHVLLDATGADEAYLHWLLDDGDYNFVYLVTPPKRLGTSPRRSSMSAGRCRSAAFHGSAIRARAGSIPWLPTCGSNSQGRRSLCESRWLPWKRFPSSSDRRRRRRREGHDGLGRELELDARRAQAARRRAYRLRCRLRPYGKAFALGQGQRGGGRFRAPCAISCRGCATAEFSMPSSRARGIRVKCVNSWSSDWASS